MILGQTYRAFGLPQVAPAGGTIALLMILLLSRTQAQIIHSASNLYVGSGVEVHVGGAVANAGFLQNQGEWFVTGDWANSGVYQGLGRLTLNGNALQRVKNNGNSFYALRINTGGGVEWQDNLAIDNTLELREGVVSVAPAYSITMANSAAIAGGSTASFIEGALIARGTGYKFFPVGRGGSYYPAELLDVSGIDPVVRVEVLDGMSSFRLAGYGRVLSTVYWQQTVLSGTYTGSPVSVGYNLPDDATSVDIFQSATVSGLFDPLGDVSTNYAADPDKVITSNVITSSLFLVGRRINVAPGAASFYFPTSLSPNAANPDNRSLRVYGDQLSEEGFLFIVFNRWGQQVYESRSLQEMSTTGWSGEQLGGGTLASGAYPYLLKGKRTNGEALEQKGTLSIVR